MHKVAGLRAIVLHKVAVHSCTLSGSWLLVLLHKVAQGCTRLQGTDTGTDTDAWVGEILPAPSCFVFTMVLVDRGYVDMWICVGVVFGHECIVDQ